MEVISRFRIETTIPILLTLGFWCVSLPPQNSFSADSEHTQPPPVFDPNEIQHGFSEFDTLPEIYSEDPPSHSSDILGEEKGSFYTSPDKKPEGLFYRIEFAEGFEEDQGLRRGHIIVPINPTKTFAPDTRAVFLVFTVHKHYAPYQVIGHLFPEKVDDLNPSDLLTEDTMYLATEDESGYLQFFPPTGRWALGSYRVQIFVGYEANQVNEMGTMRFSITTEPASVSPLSE